MEILLLTNLFEIGCEFLKLSLDMLQFILCTIVAKFKSTLGSREPSIQRRCNVKCDTKSSLVTVMALSNLVISEMILSSALLRDLERLSSCSCARRLSRSRTRPKYFSINELASDRISTDRPWTSFSSHFFPDPCVLRPPVINPLLWMIVPSSVTAEERTRQAILSSA